MTKREQALDAAYEKFLAAYLAAHAVLDKTKAWDEYIEAADKAYNEYLAAKKAIEQDSDAANATERSEWMGTNDYPEAKPGPMRRDITDRQSQAATIARLTAERDKWATEYMNLESTSGRIQEERDRLIAENERLREVEADRDRLRGELENIANAKPCNWEDPSEFRHWAQARARHSLAGGPSHDPLAAETKDAEVSDG